VQDHFGGSRAGSSREVYFLEIDTLTSTDIIVRHSEHTKQDHQVSTKKQLDFLPPAPLYHSFLQDLRHLIFLP
jgi:hypothetical protein